ncbi:MAG: hypothetical protein QM755_16875 [Luteolibacter sp.]
MKPKRMLPWSLANGAPLRLFVTLVPLFAAAAPALGQNLLPITSDTTLNSAATYDGYDPENPSLYIPTSPHFESNGQRDAVIVNNGATLTLDAGAALAVKNDDNLTAFMRVGAYGSNGTLLIGNDASLFIGQASRYANLQIGQGAGTTGTVTQTGGTVNVLGSMNVGVNGGSGSYTISGGSLTIDNADDAGHTSLVSIGFNNYSSGTSTGTFNLNGGLVELKAHPVEVSPGVFQDGSTGLIIGNRTNVALASYGGGASGSGNGVFNQTAGTLRVGAGTGFYLSGFGNGVYNFTGGTLEIGGNSLQAKYGGGAATGTYDFNFSGGTIKVAGSDLDTSVDADLGANAISTIDTNGLNATWRGNLTGTGLHQIGQGGSALVKTGAGTLTFTGSSRVLDTFAVTGGSVRQTAGDTSAVEFMAGTGTGNTGAYIMDGGTLTINASTTSGGGAVAGSFRVGDYGGTGTFTQNAGTVEFTTNSALNIGNQGGNGTYNLTGGTLILGGGNNVIGRSTVGNPASTGVMNVSGGLLEITNNSALIIGNNISGGPAGSGALVQTGGIVHVDAGSSLYVSGFGPGSYSLNGGTLEVGGNGLKARYNNTTSTYAFNFGGGTIKVTGSDLTSAVDADLTAGKTSVIDTNGLNATWSGNLAAAGLHQVDFGGNLLVKSGAGTLTLSGASRVLDSFAITGGGARQTAGATSAVEFMVGTGNGNTGSYVMDGGTLDVNASTRADNTTAVAGSFRVGDFGGTGTFTQNAGTVTVNENGALNIGNQGGTGTYNLNGGTLNLSGGLNTLGRSTGANPASTGTLNITGGALNLTDNSSLINGNNIVGAALGTGTIHQTGGTVHVDAGSNLYISGYGNGVYDLNGGTLEVGGNSLHARYSNTTSTYAFNLGGGTLKVVGSDLSSAVDAALVAGTTSTINTNALNATWSGNLTSAGAHQADDGGSQLVKSGTGTLTFSGASRVLESFAVTGGSVRQTAGATSSSEFMVGAGNGNIGSYVMDGGSLTVNASTKADNTTPVAGSLRIGDFGGTGVFTQNAGTVTTSSNVSLNIGNQGGDGTYNLNGGTLTLNGLLNTIGRSAVGKPASTGALNLSGGTLNVASGASLILGNSLNGGAQGTGTVTQTGGTLHVDGAAALYLSAIGTGTYNLDGGTLEVGGSSLQVSYGGGTPVANDFNLGGGTVKIIGSNLSTDVVGKLKASTTSTINTNGYDATFAGFTGTGTLTKTGAGTLISNGAATVGGLNIQQGTFRANQALTIGSGGLTIATGAHLVANTTLQSLPGAFMHVTGVLNGSGTLNVATTIQSGGTYSPGNSPGAMNIGADFTIEAGATFAWELGDNSTSGPGTTFDMTTVTAGNFSLENGSIFNIALLGSANYSDVFWTSDQSWVVVDNTGTGTLEVGNVIILADPASAALGHFDLVNSGNTLTLNWTAVPEPSSALLLLTVVPWLGRRRR